MPPAHRMPLIIGAAAVAALIVLAVFVGVLGAVFPDEDGGAFCAPTPGGSRTADIPAAYLALYVQAGARYGIPWQVLAAIGQAESDHGRGSGSGIRSGTNKAGAAGPMQFLAGTWKAFGLDGDHDGKKDVYDPADAIPAAAAYLRHNGAPQHLERAIFRYNHADWYVKKVLTQAGLYSVGQDPRALMANGCAAGVLPPNQVAVTVIGYARAQLGKPYVWGAAGPDAFDCSGLTMMAYRAAGISLPHNAAAQWNTLPHVTPGQQQPGDLVFFENKSDGPGHVGIFIGNGQMIEAPNHTAPVRVSTVNRPDLVGYARPGNR